MFDFYNSWLNTWSKDQFNIIKDKNYMTNNFEIFNEKYQRFIIGTYLYLEPFFALYLRVYNIKYWISMSFDWLQQINNEN